MEDQPKRATKLAIRASLDGITDILGKNGAKIIFRSAGLLDVFENPPEYSWDPSITIPEQARIYTEIANLVGYNGALAVWRRTGYTVMKRVTEEMRLAEQFKDLPPLEKFSKSLALFVIGSGKGKVVEVTGKPDEFDCFDCMHCSGCDFNRPMCTHYEGFIQYIADTAFGKDAYIAREVSCMALGDKSCYFRLVEKEE
jgi:predicted hydrocarbon binding protein